MINTFFEERVERLTSAAKRLAAALDGAGIPYRVVGGFAVYAHVEAVDPLAARLTRDLDVAVSRGDLSRIAEAVEPLGLTLRHAAGVDLLVEATQPGTRSAVHLVFVREKVRPEYVEPVPGFSEPVQTADGVLIAPVADLVRMKLTSFRLKDQVHVQDLDRAGLVTPEIEAGLPDILRTRLAQVRASE